MKPILITTLKVSISGNKQANKALRACLENEQAYQSLIAVIRDATMRAIMDAGILGKTAKLDISIEERDPLEGEPMAKTIRYMLQRQREEETIRQAEKIIRKRAKTND